MAMKPNDVRALRLGGAIVLCAFVMLRVGPWSVRSIVGLRERARESAVAEERARRVLDGSPAMHDSLHWALSEVVRLAPKLIEGRSAAEAGASLTGLVLLLANQYAMRVVRLDPATDSLGAVFARVAVRAEFEGDVRGLGRWLRAIESGVPVLTVQRLEISAPEPTSAISVPERLRIEATIAGLYWPRAGS
jgi:hypothetical protein